MSTATQPPTGKPWPPDLADIVRRTINPLQKRITGPNAHSSGPHRATVAALRNAVGQTPDRAPLAWGYVTEQVIPEFPSSWIGREDPTPQEWAAFTALTFWALHQQSQARPMHRAFEGDERYKNFGFSIGHLTKRAEGSSIKGRFDALLVARNGAAQLHHLRGLVQLLRSHEIPVDYGQLARDLASLRFGDHRKVALRWGRGFARAIAPTPSEKTPTPAS